MNRSWSRNRAGKNAAPSEPAIRTVGDLPAPAPHGHSVWIAAGLVTVAILAVYCNSLSGPFIFDDLLAIRDNPTIRRLGDVGAVFSPPGGGSAVQNRPVVNLSLAINHALGGERVFGYHLLNLAIHIIAALVLLGLVRRTLLLPGFADRFGGAATRYGTAIALLWALHPLNTEAVTYTIQRTESLFSLFYLLTLYCCVRGFGVAGGKGWFAAAIGCCLLGMGCKEAMATAPLMVLLYDRVFVARSWKAAFQRRWGLYAGLAATWILLGWLILHSSGSRGMAAGFGLGVTWWEYARTQFWAICRYLRLAFWPSGFVADYGLWIARAPVDIVPCAVLVVLLVVAALAAYVRWPWAGYLGTWFFVILAPSSSIVPLVTQTVAEKRMYLPLAAVVALVVFVGGAAEKRILERMKLPDALRRRAMTLGVGAVTCIAMVLGSLTFMRNRDYRSELAFWGDIIAKRPDNPRPYLDRGNTYVAMGDSGRALADYSKAIELQPDFPDSYYNRGATFYDIADYDRAARDFTKLIALRPDDAEAYAKRADARNALGQYAQAVQDCDRALALKPGLVVAYYHRGNSYSGLGDGERALADYSKAIELEPNLAPAYNQRGLLYLHAGAADRAVRDFAKCIALQPDFAPAYRNRADAYSSLNDADRALADYSKAIELLPDSAEAYINRGNAYRNKDDLDRALADYSKAIELNPDMADAYNNCGGIYLVAGAFDRAVQSFTKAIALTPDLAAAYSNRAIAYYNLKDYEKAREDIKALEKLGGKAPPRLMDLLAKSPPK